MQGDRGQALAFRILQRLPCNQGSQIEGPALSVVEISGYMPTYLDSHVKMILFNPVL